MPVIDTDDIAREIVAPRTEGLAAVVSAFGDEVLGPDGVLDRGRMARIVFGDPERRRVLEGILHPRIHARWQQFLGEAEARGEAVAAVIVPLLFEKGYEGQFDAVAALGCTVPTQRRRLEARGWTPEESAGRLAAQWPMERKLGAARFVIWTEGSEEAHRDQWRLVLATCCRA